MVCKGPWLADQRGFDSICAFRDARHAAKGDAGGGDWFQPSTVTLKQPSTAEIS